MLVITRHRVPAAELADWLVAAKAAVAPLAAQKGCLGLEIGCATDEPDLVVIASRWTGVGDYRRALSSFEVKAMTIPLLSTAIDEPSAFEVVHAISADGVTDHEPARAFDADEVGLGNAAGPDIRHRAE